MTDPDVIYLAPKCCADPDLGRCWAVDDEWPVEPGDEHDGHQPATRYVRADIVREQRELIDACQRYLAHLSGGETTTSSSILYVRARELEARARLLLEGGDDG